MVFNSSSSSLSSDSELDVGDKSFDDEPPSTSQDGCSDDPLSQPLYENGDMTIYDSYMLIMQYSLRHCLTKQATSDLLKPIGMLLPTRIMVSHYKLQKHFLDLYDDLTFNKRHCCSNSFTS